MKTIDNKDIKPILLNLLVVFDKICRENNIKYSLCGGTLLGAVRHKGFIPWDDDIDVFISRDGYVKFHKVFKKYSKQFHVKLLDFHSCGFYATFAKMIDTRTFSMESRRVEKLGVWMDIHIIDKMPTKELAFYNEFINNIKMIRFLGTKKYFEVSGRYYIVRNVKKIVKYFLRPLKKMIARYNIEKFLSKNHGTEEISFSFADKIQFWCGIENLDFDNLIELRFENINPLCIKSYDRYLNSKYGDYMIIPKPEDRILHDVKLWYWKSRYEKKD